MTATPETFRTVFPEFKDPGNYPEVAVDFWISTGLTFLTGASSPAANRYDPANQDYITYLFTAHHLVLGRRNAVAAAAGAVPGELQGPKSSSSVDRVAKSMDTRAVTFEDEPFWNQTSYGVQLYQILRMAGAGGVQLGACYSPGASAIMGVPFGVDITGGGGG